MTKVLVLGAQGMAGHMVLGTLRAEPDLEVQGTTFPDPADPWYFSVDTGVLGLERVCQRLPPLRYIVNCIGLTKDLIRENDPASVSRAIAINAAFPQLLSEFARSRGVRVIHLSTDGVFSPSAGTVDESSLTNSHDVYGQTKSLGEVKGVPEWLNIRCSLFGPSPRERRGLLAWFLSQPDNTQVKGFTNQKFTGVSTLQFAHLCRLIVGQDRFAALRRESPVFHFVPNPTVSKYELLTVFREVFGKNVRIIPADGQPAVERTLVTRCQGLKALFAPDLTVPAVMRELAELMRSGAYQHILRELAGGTRG